MIKITIPDEVVEAAARAIARQIHNLHIEPPIYEAEARAAILAALKAWPGATTTTWFQDTEWKAALSLPYRSTSHE